MKVSLAPGTYGFPLPVYLVGTYDSNNIPNLMAASWAGICCSQPPCIAVSLREERHTYDAIIQNQCFSMSIPTVELVKQADYLGIYSGKNTNKIKEIGFHDYKHDKYNCPIFQELPVTLICKLKEQIYLGSHTQFIGEIVDVLIEDTLLSNGKANFELLKTFCYDYTSKTYYSIGDKLSPAYMKPNTENKIG